MSVYGQWYVSVVCPHCENRLLLYRDFSEGELDLMKTKVTLRCPECDQHGSYETEHFQQPD